MSFRHGRDTAVLVGEYDLTAWMNEANSSKSIDAAETSHFGTQAKTYITGQDDGAFAFGGLFDGDPAALEDKIASIIAAPDGRPITVAKDGGLHIGRRCELGIGKQAKWEISSPVSDVVKVSGDYQCNGGIRHGVLLSDGVSFNSTTNFASVDNGVATSFGALINVHIPVNGLSADATFIVQHSANNSTWVDLQSFTIDDGVVSSQTATVTGSVLRYTRLKATLAGGSVSAIVSIGRK